MRPRGFDEPVVDASLEGIGRALARYVASQARAAMDHAPNWQASLEHLKDWAGFQLSGLGQRMDRVEERLGRLELLAARQATGADVELEETHLEGQGVGPVEVPGA